MPADINLRMPSEAEIEAAQNRARALRAEAFGRAAARAAAAIKAVVMAPVRALRRERELADLGALSDRDLKDIGLSRSDLPAIRAGTFVRREPERTAPVAAASPAPSAEPVAAANDADLRRAA